MRNCGQPDHLVLGAAYSPPMSDSDALRKKLLDWLTTQGYSLEMRVAGRFRKQANFDIRQGWHYIDPETTASREIDVVCTHSEVLGLAAVHFAISCKAGSKPWVLFRSGHTLENYNRLLRYGFLSSDARRTIADAILLKSDSNGEPIRPPLTWFWDDSKTAYAVAQAFTDKSDIPFAATLSAVKAALYCCISSPQHSDAPRFSVAFPAVVTAAPLFACSIDEAGEVELTTIDMGFLFFQQKIRDLPSVRVAIVSERGLSAYVEQCNAVASELQRIFAPAVEREWEEIQARSGITVAK